MKRNKQLIVLLVTPLIVAVAVALSIQRAPQTAKEKPRLFPELIGRINEVDEIRIQDAEATLTVHSEAGYWTVAEADDHPALVDKIKQTAFSVSDMRVIAHKTSDPERYKALGVEAPSVRGSVSHLLTLSSDGEQLASLIVGKPRKSSSPADAPGLYVRLLKQDQALLVTGRLSPSADVSEWIERNILNIAMDRVQAVQLHPTDDSPVRLERDSSEAELSLQDIPAGKEQAADYLISRMATIFENVYADGVKKAGSIDFSRPDILVRVRTFDGLLAEAQVKQMDEQTHAVFSFEVDPAQVAGEQAETQAEEPDAEVAAADEAAGSDNETDSQETPAPAVEEEAERLNKQVRGWAYQLSPAKAELFNQSLSELTRTPE